MRLSLSVLLCLVLVFPPYVFAQGGGASGGKLQIAVVDLSIPDEQAAERSTFRRFLAKAFLTNPHMVLISLGEIEKWRQRYHEKKIPEASVDELREAREILSEGKAAYTSLDFKRAVELLSEARKEFILKLPLLRSNRDLIDAHLYLGMSFLAVEKPELASAEFRRVVYLDPRRELSSREFSPQVVEAFAKSRQKVTERTPVSVRVESQPPGGQVYLNGRGAGQAPLKLRLFPGEYFILVEKPGMHSWYKPVRVKKRVETVQANLVPDTDDAAWSRLFRVREGNDRRHQDLGDVIDMASTVGADYVFLGTLEQLREYRLLGQLFDARTADFSQVAMVSLGRDLSDFQPAAGDLVETLLGFIRPDGYLLGSKKPNLGIPADQLQVATDDRPPEDLILTKPKPKKSWYEHWWIYPILAAVGVGVYFGATKIGGAGGSKIKINNKGNF